MLSGVLYWITGLSGAGKTTIGNRLYYELKKKQDNVVILDGDILKNIFSNSPQYGFKARKERAVQYAKLCKSLTDQGLVVICCTIAMFSDVRKWNRENNRGYVEIFVNTPIEVLIKRDQKGIYSGYSEGKLKDIAGEDVRVEFPQNPDIEIVNDDKNDLEKCVQDILELNIFMGNDYRRDIDYWNSYYSRGLAPEEPSLFAKYVATYLEAGKYLLELGCGNGRDSIFFSDMKLNVTAIDVSNVTIKNLQETVMPVKKNIWFICDDFVDSSLIKTAQYDYIYSRFTFHAINSKQEDALLRNIKSTIKNNGKLFIEARSVNDPLYGKGREVEMDAYLYNNHFRRFLNINSLADKLEKIGFKVIYKKESKGFAPNKNEDPPIIRIICENA